MSRSVWSVSAAFATGADVQNWQVAGEVGDLRETLAWLVKLGHVVSHTALPATEPVSSAAVFAELRERVGSLVMSAIASCPLRNPEPPAGMLVPVWPFAPNTDGMLASTARFQGTDVEITAMPSLDEETGFHIAGRKGVFLPVVMPYPSWRASSVI